MVGWTHEEKVFKRCFPAKNFEEKNTFSHCLACQLTHLYLNLHLGAGLSYKPPQNYAAWCGLVWCVMEAARETVAREVEMRQSNKGIAPGVSKGACQVTHLY